MIARLCQLNNSIVVFNQFSCKIEGIEHNTIKDNKKYLDSYQVSLLLPNYLNLITQQQ